MYVYNSNDKTFKILFYFKFCKSSADSKLNSDCKIYTNRLIKINK